MIGFLYSISDLNQNELYSVLSYMNQNKDKVPIT